MRIRQYDWHEGQILVVTTFVEDTFSVHEQTSLRPPSRTETETETMAVWQDGLTREDCIFTWYGAVHIVRTHRWGRGRSALCVRHAYTGEGVKASAYERMAKFLKSLFFLLSGPFLMLKTLSCQWVWFSGCKPHPLVVNYLQIQLTYCKVAMAGAIDNIIGSLRMRTRGRGVWATAVQGGEGSENSDFGAYVLNGRPLMSFTKLSC